jgi:hypothetical protein
MKDKLVYPVYTFLGNVVSNDSRDVINNDYRVVRRLFLGTFITSTVIIFLCLFLMAPTLTDGDDRGKFVLTLLTYAMMIPALGWWVFQVCRKAFLISDGRDLVYSNTQHRISTEVNVSNTELLPLFPGTVLDVINAPPAPIITL